MNNDFIPTSELITNPDGSVYHLHVKPGELSTNIITVGDPDRVDLVTDHFEKIEFKRESREFVTVTGFFRGKRLSVISTGIGTDNIDIVLNEVDALFQVDFKTRKLKQEHTQLTFVRIGTSGALQENIPLNSFIASKKALAFDTLLQFYGSDNFEKLADWPYELEELRPLITNCSPHLLESLPDDFFEGITATMPGFYAPQGRNFRLASALSNRLDELRNVTIEGENVTNLEMETSGIYGLAQLLGHKAISLNAILANRFTGEFSDRPKQTIEKLIELSLGWISKEL